MKMDNPSQSENIRISTFYSFLPSTNVVLNPNTTAAEVCNQLAVKLRLAPGDIRFHYLVVVNTALNESGNAVHHCLRTLNKSDLVLAMAKRIAAKHAQRVPIPNFNSSTKWFFKDSRSFPIELNDGADISGESSSEDEVEISSTDLAYIRMGERKSMMMKKSSIDPNLWRKRQCVLTDKLWCINTNRQVPRALSIPLHCNKLHLEPLDTLEVPFAVIVQGVTQVYYFRAYSTSEQQSWLTEIYNKTLLAQDNDYLHMAEVIIGDEGSAIIDHTHRMTDVLFNSEAMKYASFTQEMVKYVRTLDPDTIPLIGVGDDSDVDSDDDADFKVRSKALPRPGSLEMLNSPSTMTTTSNNTNSMITTNATFPQSMAGENIKMLLQLEKALTTKVAPASIHIDRRTQWTLQYQVRRPQLSSLVHILHEQHTSLSRAISFLHAVQDFKNMYRNESFVKPREFSLAAMRIFKNFLASLCVDMSRRVMNSSTFYANMSAGRGSKESSVGSSKALLAAATGSQSSMSAGGAVAAAAPGGGGGGGGSGGGVGGGGGGGGGGVVTSCIVASDSEFLVGDSFERQEDGPHDSRVDEDVAELADSEDCDFLDDDIWLIDLETLEQTYSSIFCNVIPYVSKKVVAASPAPATTAPPLRESRLRSITVGVGAGFWGAWGSSRATAASSTTSTSASSASSASARSMSTEETSMWNDSFSQSVPVPSETNTVVEPPDDPVLTSDERRIYCSVTGLLDGIFGKSNANGFDYLVTNSYTDEDGREGLQKFQFADLESMLPSTVFDEVVEAFNEAIGRSNRCLRRMRLLVDEGGGKKSRGLESRYRSNKKKPVRRRSQGKSHPSSGGGGGGGGSGRRGSGSRIIVKDDSGVRRGPSSQDESKLALHSEATVSTVTDSGLDKSASPKHNLRLNKEYINASRVVSESESDVETPSQRQHSSPRVRHTRNNSFATAEAEADDEEEEDGGPTFRDDVTDYTEDGVSPKAFVGEEFILSPQFTQQQQQLQQQQEQVYSSQLRRSLSEAEIAIDRSGHLVLPSATAGSGVTAQALFPSQLPGNLSNDLIQEEAVNRQRSMSLSWTNGHAYTDPAAAVSHASEVYRGVDDHSSSVGLDFQSLADHKDSSMVE